MDYNYPCSPQFQKVGIHFFFFFSIIYTNKTSQLKLAMNTLSMILIHTYSYFSDLFFFPSGPVSSTLYSQCRKFGFDPCSGMRHMVTCVAETSLSCKGPYSQSYVVVVVVFSSSHIQMWELDCKEGEYQRTDFKLWCWRRTWESIGL